MAEDCVDRLQHRLGRSERNLQGYDPPHLTGSGDARLEMLAHAQKGARIGALKAVDRLFRIAHGKDRADAIARTLAGEELFGEGGDDLPLLRIGVLRLVDQNMVETAIELEQDPRCHAGSSQQVQRLGDQILVVEHALGPLAPVIGVDQRAADTGQRAARFEQYGCRPSIAEFFDALRLGLENRIGIAGGGEGGIVSDQSLADPALYRQIDAGIIWQHLRTPLRLGTPGGDNFAAFPIHAGAARERRSGGAKPRLVARPFGAEGGDQRFRSRPRRQGQRVAKRAAHCPIAIAQDPTELAAVGGELRHQHPEAFLCSVPRHHGERLGEPIVTSQWAAVSRGNDYRFAGFA